MSKQIANRLDSSLPRDGQRLLVWTGLTAGVLVFLGLGICLVIICVRGDDAARSGSLGSLPELPADYVPTSQSPSVPSVATASSAPKEKKATSTPQAESKDPPASSPVPKPLPVDAKATPPPDLPADSGAASGGGSAWGSSKAEPPAAVVVAAASKNGARGRPEAVAKAAFFEYPQNDPPVNRASARGVAYLKRADDFRTGGKALAGLTLLSCGVPAKDPVVTKLATAVRAGLPLTATYELALCLLFLDQLGDPLDEDVIRRIALQLIAGQGTQGGWNYHCFGLNAKQEKKLLALLQAPVRRVSANQVFSLRTATGPQLPADLRDLPAMQYRPGQQLRFQQSPWHEDNSLTQFVILALWTGQKHGIPAERSLAMVEGRFRASQNSDGSWGYKWGPGFLGGSFRADSMTCAGLLGLAVGRGVEPPDLSDKGLPAGAARTPPARAPLKKPAKRPDGDRAIENALLFLSQKIGTPAAKQDPAAEQLKANAQILNLQMQLAQAPPAQRPLFLQKLQALVKIDNRLKARGTIIGANARGDLYYLWSLERVAVTYDLRTIGGKDWYAWGAPLIIGQQRDDGSWADLYPGVPDTCFALLFLKRVNVARDLTRSLQKLPLAREAAGRMTDVSLHGSSPEQRTPMAEAKGPPLRTRE
jgi:hypothetical protein